MDFKDLIINRSYISKGNNNIADSFLNPVLKYTKTYKRSVGFFSSGVFDTIEEGIVFLVRNGGYIQLIASPKLNEEDVEAIRLGYEKRKQLISNCFTREFEKEIEKLNNTKLQMLYDLIARGILDIKIAVTDENGNYHDKLGILKDVLGNTIVFYGSSNSSYSGYRSNYERIRVSKSWEVGFEEIVREEEEEFDNLWSNKNEFVEVYEYTEEARKCIIEVVEKRIKGIESDAITLRDYQKQAIKAWKDNNYHGFYVMATGTGKTWTAIYSAKELIENNPCMVVICAPYKHLVKQWSEDVEKAFGDAKIILVSSENSNWENQIIEEIIRKKYNSSKQIIIISTIASFRMKRFMETICKSDEDKLLIVDEAHRFTERPESLNRIFRFMLGLSATPFSGKSANKGYELMKFFGGQVFSLPIEEALDRGYLVPYFYYPIFVNATEDEEIKFNAITRVILSCFKNGVCINSDLLVKSLRNRLRIISMAEEKQTRIDEIIDTIEEKNHCVVYCGDGRLFDNKTGEELRHIQAIKRILSNHDFKSSQFTAKENISERMQLVDSFNKGEISALAAIRCLDEGINIPSIKSALILSSNDDYREFVQRRGRILRTYEEKSSANIYDVVVLPSGNLQQWAAIELRRCYEYGRLSKNWDVFEPEIINKLMQYGLAIDDVNIYDYEDMEVSNDE
jgi:superfamily II DNA or RNA helicase